MGTQWTELEKTSNKVTSFSETPSDEKYPSEKLVKDTMDKLEEDIAEGNLVVAQATNASYAANAGNATNANKATNATKASEAAMLRASNKKMLTFTNGELSFASSGLVVGHMYLLYFHDDVQGQAAERSFGIYLCTNIDTILTCPALNRVSGDPMYYQFEYDMADKKFYFRSGHAQVTGTEYVEAYDLGTVLSN